MSTSRRDAQRRSTHWLVLIHQLPSAPAYLRVKVSRRLAKVGAVALKNSVYLLPSTDGCREDFSWTRREIVDDGGEASVFEATVVEGLTQSEAVQLFREARGKDYEELRDVLEAAAKRAARARPQDRQAVLAELARIDEQLGAIERIDFFPGGVGAQLRAQLTGLRRALDARASHTARPSSQTLDVENYRGRTWVTRAGVKVDRVACAWLIKRFIDPKASFKFVEWSRYQRRTRELSFDTPEGEFTHEADACSFEVLCRRFGLSSPPLLRIGEIIHELDIKDGRYLHPETDGVRVFMDGLIAQHARDEDRIKLAATMFEALLRATPPQPHGRTTPGGRNARGKGRPT